MNQEYPRGRFVWYELMTTDTDAAKRFYGDVVGWSSAPFEGAPMPYTMWQRGEKPIGGLMELPAEARKGGVPPHWLAYVSTPDVDATVERAKKLGGQVIMGPDEIPNVGRFAVLKDPQGAAFALHSSNTQPGEEGDPEIGDISWHELATTNHEKAFDFYADLFGWEKSEAMDMGEAGTYQMYGRNGRMYGGMYNKSSDMPGPPLWTLYAQVPSADEAAERVKKSGGQVVNGPMDVPGGGRIAQCIDPQGAMFAVHSQAG